MDDLGDMTKEQLLDIIEDLEKEIADKDDEIADLTSSQVKGKGKKSKAGNNSADDIEELAAELEELHIKLDTKEAEVTGLREELASERLRVSSVNDEKVETDKKLKAANERTKQLEKEVSKLTAESSTSKQMSKSAVEQNKANYNQSVLVSQENQRLQEQIKELEEQYAELEASKSEIEEILVAQSDKLDAVQIERDNFELEKQEIQSLNIQLMKALDDLKLEFDEVSNSEKDWQEKYDQANLQIQALNDQIKATAAIQKKETADLTKQIAMLKDTTKVGEKQNKIEALQREHADNIDVIKHLQKELEEALFERDSLAAKLSEDSAVIDTKVAEKVSAERNKAKQLEIMIERLKQQNAENVDYYAQLEQEKNELSTEVDELLNWKSIYEANHGLQELSRNQKKLKDDNRRLTVAVEQLSSNIDMLRNTNNVLALSFDKLKVESGKPATFQYPEYELQVEVQSMTNKLKAELFEVEKQVMDLEKENTRIRRALQNQAGSIGQDGFKYAGMLPEQLVKVNDFAMNLKEGKVDLPLDDQSRALLKEVKSLKDQLAMQAIQLQRYEREIGGAINQQYHNSSDDVVRQSSTSIIDGQLPHHQQQQQQQSQMLNNTDMSQIIADNKELHFKMNTLQNDLINLIKGTTAHATDASGVGASSSGVSTATGMISANDLAVILGHNNELMLKEIQQLRSAGSLPLTNGQGQIMDLNAYNQMMFQQQQAQAQLQSGSKFSQFRSQHQQAQQQQHHVTYDLPPSGKASNAAATTRTDGVADVKTPAKSTASLPVASNLKVDVTASTPMVRGSQPQVMYTPAPMYGAGQVGGNPNLWTPMMGRGGMPFVPAGMPMATPYGAGGAQFTAGGPQTPHGKQLLNHTITALNLPPEEWAVDIKELNATLIECLEQLYERDSELNDSQHIIANLEENLVTIKQQLAALYYDYSKQSDSWEEREKTMKTDLTSLNHERDDLKLKLSRLSDLHSLLKSEDTQSIEQRLIETTRKLTIYEVNETILSRKYIAQSEQLTAVETVKTQLESDFVEMEASLKKRILYLEQHKLNVSARLGHLQGKLDSSVPVQDYLQLQLELENLREDHLNTLRREVEARMSSLKGIDTSRELRFLKLDMLHKEVQLEGNHSAIMHLESELIHQKEATERALKAVSGTSGAASGGAEEVVGIISEMARFRGEASRLEVELLASNRRAELLMERIGALSSTLDESSARIMELEQRETDVSAKESEARKQLLQLQLDFEGGLTKAKADELKATHEKTKLLHEEASRECLKYKELAEIASQQAQSLSEFRKSSAAEIQELREYCTRLESNTEDDLRIGRLQRELMSTKSSYKAFVRKYNFARESMRKRELAMRILEKTIDDQEKAIASLHDTSRLEVSALKKALRNMKNTVVEETAAALAMNATTIGGGGVKKQAKSRKSKNAAGVIHTVSIGQKLLNMSDKVDELSSLAEGAVHRASEAEKRAQGLLAKNEDLDQEKALLEQKVNDLIAITAKNPKNKELGQRLASLTDDLKTVKLLNLDQRRKIQILTQEKQHLQSIISNIEADVQELEEDKVTVETNNLLFNMNQSHHDTTIDSHKNNNNKKNGGKKGDVSTANIAGLFSSHDDGDADDDEDGRGAGRSKRSGINNNNGSKPRDDDMDQLALDLSALDAALDADDSAENLLRKLRAKQSELMAAERELSNDKLVLSRLHNDIIEYKHQLQEKDGHIAYCERVLREHGYGSVLMNGPGANTPGHHNSRSSTGPSAHQHLLMQQEHGEKMQAAATATISSLRSLLEDKNREIDKYVLKIEHLESVAATRVKSRADLRADGLLEQLNQDDAAARKYNKQLCGAMGKDRGETDPELVHQRLLSQLEQSDVIIKEKETLIRQLEMKLNQIQNQCERAESRCGEALQEVENMQADMLTLVQQNADKEEKLAHMTHALSGTSGYSRTPRSPVRSQPSMPPAQQSGAGVPQVVEVADRNSAERIRELERKVRAMKEKTESYRTALIKLKDEFIKSEEEKAGVLLDARKAVEEAKKGGNRGGTMKNSTAVTNPRDRDIIDGPSADQVREIQDRLVDMRQQLKFAKEDFDKMKKKNTHLEEEAKETKTEMEGLVKRAKQLEGQMFKDNEAMKRMRGELEESKKKEVRLREKLKEVLGAASGVEAVAGKGGVKGGGVQSLAKARETIEHLERELDLVKTQNIALRKQDYEARGGVIPQGGGGGRGVTPERGVDERKETGNTPSRGYVLGGTGGNVLGGGSGEPIDESRQALHDKWGKEKDMRKRIETLNARLKEAIDDKETLQAEVQKFKALADKAVAAREIEAKRAAAATKQTTEAKKLNADDLSELQKAQENVFHLQEELDRITRIAQVEQPNEIKRLEHQLSTQRALLTRAESELQEESERRRKQAVTTSATIREEEQYHTIARLKDQLSIANRIQRELESDLLNRDARAQENRYDIEQKQNEIERLQRRVTELSDALKSMQAIHESASAIVIPGVKALASKADASYGHNNVLTSTGVRSKREKELEHTIEVMNTVIAKQNAEKARLEKLGPPEQRGKSEIEKKYQVSQRNLEKLEEEMLTLKLKVKNSEDNAQKLVERQMQITSLRKQLKQKQDEFAVREEQNERLLHDKDVLQKRIETLTERIQSLELSLAQSTATRAPTGPTTKAEAQALQQRENALATKINDLSLQNERLKTDLNDARKQLQSGHFNAMAAGGGTRSSTSSHPGQSHQPVTEAEFTRLKDENEKLRLELSAFDMSFFDEIENLKYAHLEAVRKLKIYEQREQSQAQSQGQGGLGVGGSRRGGGYA